MTVGIGKQNDLDKAKAIIRHILENDPRVLKDPAPVVAVLELAESSVKLAVRPWVKADDYGEVLFDTLEAMKKQLHAEGF